MNKQEEYIEQLKKALILLDHDIYKYICNAFFNQFQLDTKGLWGNSLSKWLEKHHPKFTEWITINGKTFNKHYEFSNSWAKESGIEIFKAKKIELLSNYIKELEQA